MNNAKLIPPAIASDWVECPHCSGTGKECADPYGYGRALDCGACDGGRGHQGEFMCVGCDAKRASVGDAYCADCDAVTTTYLA